MKTSPPNVAPTVGAPPSAEPSAEPPSGAGIPDLPMNWEVAAQVALLQYEQLQQQHATLQRQFNGVQIDLNMALAKMRAVEAELATLRTKTAA